MHKLSSSTRYAGNVRAINNDFLDAFGIGSPDLLTVLDVNQGYGFVRDEKRTNGKILLLTKADVERYEAGVPVSELQVLATHVTAIIRGVSFLVCFQNEGRGVFNTPYDSVIGN